MPAFEYGESNKLGKHGQIWTTSQHLPPLHCIAHYPLGQLLVKASSTLAVLALVADPPWWATSGPCDAQALWQPSCEQASISKHYTHSQSRFFLMTITSKNKTCKICKMHYIKCCRWPIWVFCFSLPQGETPLWDFETAPTHHSQACSCGSSSTLPLALAGTVCSPACRRTSVLKTNPHQPHLKGCNPAEKQRTTMLQWWLRSWCGRRPAPPRHLVPQEHKSYVALWWELETPGSWCSAKTATLHRGSESEFWNHDFMFKNLFRSVQSTKIGSWSLQWFGRVIRPYHKPEKTQTRTSCESDEEGSHWGTAARLSKDTNYPYSTTWLRGKKSQDFMSYQNGTKFQEMSNEAKHNQGTKSCGCTTMAVRAKMARQTSAMQTRHVLPSLIREYIEYHRRLIQDMQTKAYTRIDWLDRLDMHFLSFICVHDT